MSDGGLGDVDGDGDLDLIAPYKMPNEDGDTSWLVAPNQGDGSFGRAIYRHGRRANHATLADVDGDGYVDVVCTDGSWHDVAYVRNDPEVGWVVQQRFPDRILIRLSAVDALADADGDGDEDLWLLHHPGQGTLWLLPNEGEAGFGVPRAVGTDLIAEGYRAAYIVADAGPQGELGMTWWRDDGRALLALWTGDDFGRRIGLPNRLKGAYEFYQGDLEPDGDVDMAYTVTQRIDVNIPAFRDLRFLLNRGDGAADTLSWPQDVTLPAMGLQVVDLNGDGHLDVAFVDSDLRQPAVVVALGVGQGLPVQEGRYPLCGRGGFVKAGDVDGDGDIDLVVHDMRVDGHGGVHVLLNRLADGATAVADELARGNASSSDRHASATLPAEAQLHPAYPNPFNPETVIPFTLAQALQSVRLQIYNVMGQPVRTLVDQALEAGVHRVRWDGRDERGSVVPSGVYFCRLRADGVNSGRKIVRLQ